MYVKKLLHENHLPGMPQFPYGSRVPVLYWGKDTISSDKITSVHKERLMLLNCSLIGPVYWSLISKLIKLRKSVCMHKSTANSERQSFGQIHLI